MKPDIELGNIDLLAEFARLGYGVAFISRSFVQQELDSGTLFELKLEDSLSPRSIGFALHRDMNLSVAAEAFVEILRSSYDSFKYNVSTYKSFFTLIGYQIGSLLDHCLGAKRFHIT